MATVNDLIEASLRDLGVLASGEAAEYDDANDGLGALNRLLDQWKAERLRMYSVTRTTWTIVSGTGTYTVGTGGDVNVARPVHVTAVNFIDTSQSPDAEFKLDRLTEDAYSNIRLKTQTSDWPSAYYYNPTYAAGLASLFLWPVPTSATLEGAIYAWAEVSEYTDLTTTVALPPGYERMIVKELAIELAPSYNRQPNPLLLEQASDARAAVKRANKRLMDMSVDFGALIQGRDVGGYDIYTG